MRKLLSFVFIFFFVNTIYYGFAQSEESNTQPDRYKYVYNREFKLYHPEDFKPQRPEKRLISFKHIDLFLYARSFAQGNAVYAEIFKNETAHEQEVKILSMSFNGKEVPLSQREWGIRTIFAIPPEMKPGKKEIVVSYLLDGVNHRAQVQTDIGGSAFPFSRVAMDLGKYSDMDYQEKPEVIEFIKECILKKKEAYSSEEPDLLESDKAHPRDLHYITSGFWSKRTIKLFRWKNGKKIRMKNRIKIHRGLDLRGKTGRPVYAIGHGKVVLADTLYYEGNMVIIDHGNKIFSYYMHLNKLKVKKGKKIKAGQVIGTVGESGISTASHLHVSLMIHGVQVDPLSFLDLPLR